MSVDIRVERDGDRIRVMPAGPFDLAHAATVAQAVERVQPQLVGCRSVDGDLADLGRFDGAGAVLLARFLDRLDSEGRCPRVLEGGQPDAARLIALYRERRVNGPTGQARATGALGRIGAFKRPWLAACRVANVTDLRWHDLRHEYASRLVEHEIPLSQVRDLLGHASTVTTERYDNQKTGGADGGGEASGDGRNFQESFNSRADARRRRSRRRAPRRRQVVEWIEDRGWGE